MVAYLIGGPHDGRREDVDRDPLPFALTYPEIASAHRRAYYPGQPLPLSGNVQEHVYMRARTRWGLRYIYRDVREGYMGKLHG